MNHYSIPDQFSVLPEGSLVLSATGYGGSYWSQTGKIDVRLANGANVSYFIKVCHKTITKRFSIALSFGYKLTLKSCPEIALGNRWLKVNSSP